jgi:hypothetical protein
LAPAAAENYPIGDPIENTEVYNDETDGVLRLKLDENPYEWEFVPVEGKSSHRLRAHRVQLSV